jgi:hypothetical protein
MIFLNSSEAHSSLIPEAKQSPRGELCPLGVKCSVRPSILLNSRECSPLGVNEGVNISPRGQISPLWARGQVKTGPEVTLFPELRSHII